MRAAKELLQRVHERFPIRPETHGQDFMGTHSLTIKGDHLLISIWAKTPEGVRSFTASVEGKELDFLTPDQVCDELDQCIHEWTSSRSRSQPRLI